MSTQSASLGKQPSKWSVGQTVVVSNYMSRTFEAKITKIGRVYFEAAHTKFQLLDGRQKENGYTPAWAYTPEEWAKKAEITKAISELRGLGVELGLGDLGATWPWCRAWPWLRIRGHAREGGRDPCSREANPHRDPL